MSVLHPGLAIAAVMSVSVPILIHLLLRRRRRVIEWAAMDLLQRAMRRDRRRQRVERWLLLAARCLLVSIGGLALAQPFIGSGDHGETVAKTVWLVIDDGVASAERIPEGGTALGRSVAEARRIVESLRPSDRAGVITAAAPVRRLVDPPTADKTRLDALLAQMTPADSGSDLAGAIGDAVAAVRRDQDSGDIVLLGGFRRGSLDPASTAPTIDASLIPSWRLLALPPLSGFPTNAWIASAEPVRRGEEATIEADRTIRVRIERRGESLPRSVRRATASGAASGAADIAIENGERRGAAELRLRGAGSGAETHADSALAIELDADAQPRDDRMFQVLPPEQPSRVVVLDRRGGSAQDLERLGSGVWMARAVAPGRGAALQVDEVDPGSLDRTVLRGADAAILARPDLVTEAGWSTLREFVDSGAVLVVAPSPDDAGQRWTERFRTSLVPSWRVEPEVEASDGAWRLAPQQPPSATLRVLGSEISVLAAPVTATRRLRISAPASDAETALLFDDGQAMLLCGRPGGAPRGWVALLAVAPELSWTDLPVRPLMVPLLQELVRQGRSLASLESANLVGRPAALPRGAAALRVRPPTAAESSARGPSIIQAGSDDRTREPVLVPGLHEAVDESGRVVGSVAVNVDPARASIEPNDSGAVLAWLEKSGPWRWLGEDATSGGAVESVDEDRSRWSIILLAAAIAVALVETVLARVLSRSDVREHPA